MQDSSVPRLPPLNALRAFERAAGRSSFRAAAEDLNVTQGAVAQHVRRLEETLGVKLFDRQPKGLTLTDAGRALRAEAEKVPPAIVARLGVDVSELETMHAALTTLIAAARRTPETP